MSVWYRIVKVKTLENDANFGFGKLGFWRELKLWKIWSNKAWILRNSRVKFGI